MLYSQLNERRRELVLLDLRERVAKGVALLDGYDPGWRLAVDVEALDIPDEDLCILGQVFGNYFEGKDRLGINGENGSVYGFDTYGFYFPGDVEDAVWVLGGIIKNEWLRHL